MNLVSRTITGGAVFLLGVGLLIASFFKGLMSLLFYAIPLLILGVIIFFNKKEDEIEKIKMNPGGKKK
jgi:hypothetical protein